MASNTGYNGYIGEDYMDSENVEWLQHHIVYTDGTSREITSQDVDEHYGVETSSSQQRRDYWSGLAGDNPDVQDTLNQLEERYQEIDSQDKVNQWLDRDDFDQDNLVMYECQARLAERDRQVREYEEYLARQEELAWEKQQADYEEWKSSREDSKDMDCCTDKYMSKY